MTDQDAHVETIWVFHGEGAAFASGVFRRKDDALSWAAAHQLTGTLSEYPLDRGTYDDAVERGRFSPTKPHHGSSSHVARFSPAWSHVHLVAGSTD